MVSLKWGYSVYRIGLNEMTERLRPIVVKFKSSI